MGDPFSALTQGCLREITADALTVAEPIVQCVQIKPMGQNASNPDVARWRVVMNDGVNFMQGMLGQQINHLVNDEKLKKGHLLRLKHFQANYVKDKHILVLFEFDILEEYGTPDKLGVPVAIEPGAKQEGDVKPQPGNIASNGFYGNKSEPAQPQQPQQRTLPSRGGGAGGGGGHGNIFPIEAISPYSHRWTIKARCSHKSDIKTWHNKNGEGKLFSVNFLDESGEIRATGFNDAVDQWHDMLQEGSVYYVSTCKVQLAKKQFSNVNNDYELTFEKDTMIEKAEDTEGVPQINYEFTTLSDLQTVAKDATIDCIGILQDVGEVSEIVSKTTSKPYNKRELTLVDNTGYSVRLTIWGKSAQEFETQADSVVAFKGVKVSDFGGRSLSLLSSGSMKVDPDIEEAHNLKGWYEGSGRTEQFQSHANTMSTANAASGGDRNATKTIAQVRDENLGMSDETDWFSIKATIIYVKQDSFSYTACQTEGCNKKVTETSEGEWRCEKCDKTWDSPNHRFIMNINVSDHTGQIWLSCFNETGEQLMGMTANELMAIKEEGDERKLAEAFNDANCKEFVFRCRANMTTFQDQQKVRYQVQYARNLDFSAEAKKLADIIKQYSIDSDSLFVN